ncbi:cytochrome b [Fodinicurvata sp. EGI_FJ10296]|uniref:cytochrome b n=1 Tax=Fodinicurvata sp. EGI_FJ10296 TaxID=3231908 RepID=UPI003455E0E0
MARINESKKAGRGYGTVARLFHWATVLLVLVMLAAGIAMTSEGFEAIGDPLFILHKNLGVIIFFLVVARLIWRLTHRPDPLPDSLTPLERRVAGASHAALYALMLTMTVTGYFRVVGGGFPIELLDALGIPPLVSPSTTPGMEDFATTLSVIHKVTAFVFVAVIAAHVTAALNHALILRNGVFRRIWPPVAPRGNDRGGV